MSFSKEEIEGMLKEYEQQKKIKINIELMSEFLYEYTSGYPLYNMFLTSAEEQPAITKEISLANARVIDQILKEIGY